MAIMNTCCCCGVRSGSTACAIYSLVISILGILMFTWNLINLSETKEALYELELQYPGVLGDLNIDAYICATNALYICGLVFLGSVFFTSIVLMVGISKDSKGMLIPFLVTKGIGLLWYIFAFAVNIYAMVSLGYQYAGFSVLGFLIVLGPFFITDVVCVLCVLSQYQEYRDGRGRLSDNMMVQRQTTVVIQQHAPMPTSGGFAYQPMNNPPPAYTQKM